MKHHGPALAVWHDPGEHAAIGDELVLLVALDPLHARMLAHIRRAG